MINKLDMNKCTGCKMCGDVCHSGAINFRTNKEGFWYPEVNADKCINCGLCIKFCPAMDNFKSKKFMPKVYAAWSNDKSTRIESTSGGLYYELAKCILEKGGYIAGAQYTEDYKGAEHIISNSFEGLQRIKGSKYFQSDTTGVYNEIKRLLDNSKAVLFCGTPCQNAALTKFLELDYQNLIQCDFICRGVNSPKAYRKYLEMIEHQYGSEVAYVHFKDKMNGWNKFGVRVELKNGETYYEDRYHDMFIVGYTRDNLFMRPSCHNCQYKTLPRVSDICLGDFWGIRKSDKNPDLEMGTSVVLVNSEKGKEIFQAISHNISFYEQTIDDVTSGNFCLLNRAHIGKNRDAFLADIDNLSFDELMNKYSSDKS